MASFFGTFENKVDRKGRVSVPATFRQALAGETFQGIIAFPAREGPALEGCGMAFMDEQVFSKMEVDLLTGKAANEPPEIFYTLKQLTFDGEGRVMLPTDFREQAGIEEQATFVGVGPLFQIWSPERLAEFRAAKRGGAS